MKNPFEKENQKEVKSKEEILSVKAENLEEFQRLMTKLKEEISKEKAPDPHWVGDQISKEGIDPKKLTEEDLKMYNLFVEISKMEKKIKDKEELEKLKIVFQGYKEKIFKTKEAEERKNFAQWLINQITPILGRIELKFLKNE